MDRPDAHTRNRLRQHIRAAKALDRLLVTVPTADLENLLVAYVDDLAELDRLRTTMLAVIERMDDALEGATDEATQEAGAEDRHGGQETEGREAARRQG